MALRLRQHIEYYLYSIESSTEHRHKIVVFCFFLGLFVCMWKEKGGIQVLCTWKSM